MLLENGAEINNKDNIGDTPLNDGFIITYKGFLVFFLYARSSCFYSLPRG